MQCASYVNKDLKEKAIHWANTHQTVCILDSNHYQDPYSQFDLLIAAEKADEIKAHVGQAFDQLEGFIKKHPKKFILGYFSYDLKNELEGLSSNHDEQLEFFSLCFFLPKYLILIKGERITIYAPNPEAIYKAITQTAIPSKTPIHFKGTIQSRLNYTAYQEKFNALKKHIQRGDIYEVTFCQEFFVKQAQIDPFNAFLKLNQLSPTPFASFFKNQEHYILSASPERFLARRASKLISQPIKGTIKRNTNNKQDDQAKKKLRNNPKELAENVMIVDLVRNDLTKSAQKGTVSVEELFGIYSFKQVHQMISTIVCQANPALSNVEIIKNTFPMGSMTGAPKIRAMELIEKYECIQRGVYSGAVGYFSPEGNFDFNVIIRTLLYNKKKNYLSFQVGSAITLDARAEQEYHECLLKAQAIMELLTDS